MLYNLSVKYNRGIKKQKAIKYNNKKNNINCINNKNIPKYMILFTNTKSNKGQNIKLTIYKIVITVYANMK